MLQFVVVLDKVSSEICENLAEDIKGLENIETIFLIHIIAELCFGHRTGSQQKCLSLKISDNLIKKKKKSDC